MKKISNRCIVCKNLRYVLSTHTILSKYKIKYFKCENCGVIQTEEPYWLNEAYTDVIANADTGLLSRNLLLRNITATTIINLFSKDFKYLDYAGGYGVLTRLMRDIGFDYYWYDPLSVNLFSRHFEHKKGNKYELVTAFEFLEHIQNPVEELSNIFTKHDCKAILFSTTLYKDPVDKDWWYFAYETGQHISFYNKKTLQYIANKLGCYLYTNSRNIHLISKIKVNPILFWIATNLWFLEFPIIKYFIKSRTFRDHVEIIKRK